MGILVDLILAAIVIISAVIGWKKGIFRSVMRLGSVIIAAVAAYFLSDTVSTFLNNLFFQPKVSDFVYKSFGKTFGNASLETLFSEFPDHFRKWVETYSTAEHVNSWYSGTQEATVKGLSNSIAGPIAEQISDVTSFILSFIVLFILIRLICFICDKFLKLPVLNTVNQTLGLLFGLAAGICIAWVAAEAFRAGLPELSKIYPIFEGADANSVFLEKLCEFNPLTILDIFS